MADNNISAGNIYDKYHTKNPFYRYVTQRFLSTLDKLIMSLGNTQAALEVGCGEGHLLHHINCLSKFTRLEGIDISEAIIKKANALYPSLKFKLGSAYNLNYNNDEFDLILACEVLEHIEDCDKALSEIRRVTGKYCIISVPLEPLWRILNLARNKYIFSLGNTPGHIQHCNKENFLELIKRYFVVEKIYYPLPWQIALCKK